jgi:hypothetical protein
VPVGGSPRRPGIPIVEEFLRRKEAVVSVQDDPRFQRLAAAFVEECRRRGVRLDQAAAVGVLTSQVSLYSHRAHVSDLEVLERYFDSGWPRRFAALFVRCDGGAGRRTVEPDRWFGLDNACSLLAALARTVQLAVASGGRADRAECDLAIASAAVCIAELGAAVRARTSPDVVVPGSAVRCAREVLDVAAERVAAGAWRLCWCRDLLHEHEDRQLLVEQLQVDLLLVD